MPVRAPQVFNASKRDKKNVAHRRQWSCHDRLPELPSSLAENLPNLILPAHLQMRNNTPHANLMLVLIPVSLMPGHTASYTMQLSRYAPSPSLCRRRNRVSLDRFNHVHQNHLLLRIENLHERAGAIKRRIVQCHRFQITVLDNIVHHALDK